jgi:hypothetical protein
VVAQQLEALRGALLGRRFCSRGRDSFFLFKACLRIKKEITTKLIIFAKKAIQQSLLRK